MIYIVKKGDYLSLIGQRLGIRWQDIAALNNIGPPYTIWPGQELLLPGKQIDLPAQRPVPVFAYRTYKKWYGIRPVQIFVAKFDITKVATEVLYGYSSVSRTVKGHDLAVNASFFEWPKPIGRHLLNGQRVDEHMDARPALVLDDGSLHATHETWWQMQARGVKNCISSYPAPIQGGKINISSRPASLNSLHPRTAIGRAGNQLIVLVADGRQTGYSHGLTMAELASLMWAEGCRDWALNLDGGGSSTMYYGGRVVNRPCYGERSVVNVLAFKAK